MCISIKIQDPSSSTSSNPFPPKTPLPLLLPIDHIWSKISHPRLDLLLTHCPSPAVDLPSLLFSNRRQRRNCQSWYLGWY
ncbi:hypothetical protein TorRG33x02_233370 [Trema orientale]|uniref:Uncharacterized protein n=1 Tax=Trema orientale TaxID=63057 RepID=A0A2P5E5N0_TREOI|nr:hypothetical protein TorRG33x02_233370 [Trema orientale]